MKDLTGIILKGFPHMPWDSVLKCNLLQFEYGYNLFTTRELLRQFGKVLVVSFFSREVYSMEKNDSKIIFYQSCITRLNVLESLNSIRSLVKSDLLQATFGIKRLRFKQGLLFLFSLIPSWNLSLRNAGLTLKERIAVLNELLVLFRLNDQLSKIDLTGYKLLVTYYDSPANESYAVEYFRKFGVNTVSLQHGQFVSWCANTFMDCGIEFKTFKSDYLLCWNQFTVDEAIKMGIEPSKLIITGIWSYVNKSRQLCNKNHKGIFGVIISHPNWDDENRNMIQAANILSERFGLHYYLKLHPYYKETAFDSIVNKNYLGSINGLSLLDYANSVDFTIVGSSSVYIELAFVEHDIYHYSSGEPKDKFKSIKVGKNFHTPVDLERVYGAMKAQNCSKQLFDYLCTIEDVTFHYKQFLERFI